MAGLGGGGEGPAVVEARRGWVAAWGVAVLHDLGQESAAAMCVLDHPVMDHHHAGARVAARRVALVLLDAERAARFTAAAGHLYGPQEERGLYRTQDGGETWQKVLASGPNSGAIDVVMNPSNPRIIFAATWPMRSWTWGRESGGPASGMWMRRDGGDRRTRRRGPRRARRSGAQAASGQGTPMPRQGGRAAAPGTRQQAAAAYHE